MHRNLITRLGVATGIVAAIIALVFVLVFDTVRTDRDHTREAERAEQIADTAQELRLVVRAVQLGIRAVSEEAAAGDLRAARAELPALSQREQRLSAGERAREQRAQAIDERLTFWLRVEVDPVIKGGAPAADQPSSTLSDLRTRLAGVERVERTRADNARARSDGAEQRATVLTIAGLGGSAALIFLLTAYLAQYIVVPLRRVGRAAQRIAAGDLSARVAEEGDAEPVELARSFNAMAASLEQRSAELARRVRINNAVLDATPDAIALYGPDGGVVLQNAPMEALGHENRDETGDDPDREIHDELEHDGRVLARFAAPVRDASGDLLGRIVVLRDITAERESERLKDDFFALVSHELRTPLTSILGFLELVLDEDQPLDPGVRRQLEVVHRNARRLLRLVGDMLFVAQARGGRLTIQRRTVDLGEVAAEAVEAARPAAEAARVVLTLRTEPVQPVIGDRDRLGQMLDNLVSNAIKFTPRDGDILVRVGPGDDPSAGAAVEVVDTGPGVPPDEQERLFERFYRAPGAIAANVPGMGLGLTIVQTIARAHGGTVQLVSPPGEGLAVRVQVPYAAGGGGEGER